MASAASIVAGPFELWTSIMPVAAVTLTAGRPRTGPGRCILSSAGGRGQGVPNGPGVL